MKKQILLLAILFNSAFAVAQIDLSFGVQGSITGYPQSFNESRGVDIKVLSPVDIHMVSMTLGGFYTSTNPTAWVCPRVYDPVTGVLLASGNDTIPSWMGTDITVPVAYTLKAGQTYRVGFYCYGPAEENGAFMFEPHTMPYNDQYNLVQVTHAYSYAADTIPVYTNIFVPLITINASNLAVQETKNDAQVAVYPNPATASATISFNNAHSTPCTFRLYNAEGQLLSVMEHITGNTITLQRNGLPGGLYFFKITGDGAINGNGKLVWH